MLAAYVSRVRGALAAPDDIVVTSGFRQALNVVLRALATVGVTHVALEDPGPTEHDRIVARAGLVPVSVAVDERGLDVAALAATPSRAVVVTPAHQCPTGVLLAPERRHALVEWAVTTGGVVLEDDYDAEFRYDRQPVGSLQGLAPDRVVAMGTVSKTLASGLRLGWMVVPPALRRPILDEKSAHRAGRPCARSAGAGGTRRVRSLRQAPAPDAGDLRRPPAGARRGAGGRRAGRRADRARCRLPRRAAAAGRRSARPRS